MDFGLRHAVVVVVREAQQLLPGLCDLAALARKVLGRPKRCKLAHAFLWEQSYKRLELAQLLGQLGVYLTCQYASDRNNVSLVSEVLVWNNRCTKDSLAVFW